jgi:hypothetical protein
MLAATLSRTIAQVELPCRMVNTHAMPRRPRQPRTARSRRRPITATEARRRAIAHAVRRMLDGAKVVDGKRAGLTVYGLPREGVWIVFKPARGVPALRSAEITAVCQRTGRILYDGPANDEG